MDVGPKVGDAASLWNFTPSPGWTKEEVLALKVALEKFGIGRWVQIVDSGVLPGKLIQQLNGQTQRLLGQQSIAAFTGLHVDVDAVRKDNEAKQGEGIMRKSGLIINTGGTTNKAKMDLLRAENEKKYGLSKAYVDALVLPAPVKPAHATATLERQAQAGGHRAKGKGKARPKLKLAVMAAPVDALSGSQRLALLRALYLRLQQLLGRGGAAPAAPAVAPDASAAPAAAASKPAAKKRARAPAKDADADGPAKSRPRGKAVPAVGDGASDIDKLVAMGFDARKSADALAENEGDVERAIQWLFANTA